MRVQCEFCKQEYGDAFIRQHQEICKKYRKYIKKNVKEHLRSINQHETFSCILCNKEMISQTSMFVHLSQTHFKNSRTKSEVTQGTKVVNSTICGKCEKCSQWFIVSKAKTNSSKICQNCTASNALQNQQPFVASSPMVMKITKKEKPKKQSSDTDEEKLVIDIPFGDYNSSDDNLDYLD